MKKLMTVIAAAAMSFGLFAEGEVLKHGNSFEAGDQNVSEDGKTFTTDQTVWTAGDEAATFNIGTYDGDKYTGYGAEGTPTARRDGEFVAEDTNNSYLKLKDGSVTLSRVVSDNSIFVDQLVKFTSFDEIPEIDADAKIAIWKAGLEDDDGEVTNNCLYVAVGDGAGNVKNVRLVGEYENDTWYRLTIRDDGEVSTEDAGEAGFVIYIDGVQAQIVADDRAYRTDGGDGLKNTAKNLYRAGKLFTSIGTKLASFGIASVGYKGIGAIDDVIIDSVGPEFASAEITATIAAVEGANLIGVKDADGNTVDFAGEGPWTFAIASGSDVTLTFEPAEGYSFKGNPVKTVTVNDETAIDVSEDLQAFEVYATKVNGETTKYGEDELYGMITSLVDGDVVTFNKAATIADEEGVEFYEVTADTDITVTKADDLVTWQVEADGSFVDNVGADTSVIKTFAFDTEDGILTLGGNVAGAVTVTVGSVEVYDEIEITGNGVLMVNGEINNSGTITLAGDAKVITTSDDLDLESEGEVEMLEDTPTEGLNTYQIKQAPEVEYVNFTVTYNADQVENVTVTTNGEAVAEQAGVYMVESNAVVTITAMAKEDFKNVTITGDNVTVTDGEFTADKAESVITISAEACKYATAPTGKQEVVYSGNEQDGLEGGSNWKVSEGDAKGTNAGNYSVKVVPADDCDGWSDDKTSKEARTINWSIAPAAGKVEVTIAPVTVKEGETYDVTVELNDAVITEGFTGVWTDKDGKELLAAPTTEGVYTYTATLVPGNYTGADSATLTIEKAGPVIPEPEDLPEAEKTAYDNWYTSNPADPADVALTKPEDLKDAYLLGCKAGEEALEAARKEFQFASIELVEGEWVATIKNSTGDNHEFYGNGAITVKSYSDVECKTEAENGNFFKATLGYKTK